MQKRISLRSFQKTESQIKQSLRTAVLVTAGLRIAGCIVYGISSMAAGSLSGAGAVYQFSLLAACVMILAMRFADPSGRRVRYLLFLEFFCVQVVGFHQHQLTVLEYFYLPLIMIDIALMFPMHWAIPLELIYGLLFGPFMGYSLQARTSITLDGQTFSLLIVTIPFFGACTYCCCVLALLIFRQRQMQQAHCTEITINRNLDSINRILSTQMFSIRSESEILAKKEVTKDVHDNVGYIFTNLIMMLQATEAVFEHEPQRARAMLSNCVDYGCQGMNTIRETLRTIRQSESRSNANIQREIHALAILFSRCTGTSVHIEFGNWPKHFRPEVDSFLLSFVKEGLTNALKHGMATSIQILCSVNKQHLRITIEDNGIGLQSNEIRYGIGLQSIAETVAHLGGEVKIASHEKGFCIHVQLPV